MRGRAALGAASQWVEQTLEAILPEEPAANVLGGSASPAANAKDRVLVLSRRAMACEFQIRLNASDDENPTEAGMVALDLIEKLETQLTVYRETSEMIELNRLAAQEPFEVEPKLFALLKLADRLWHATDGAFDITCGPLSRAWGFSQREGQMPKAEDLEQARANVGWQHVELDENASTVRFKKEGIELNLNSIGKGYALDRAGELLNMWDVNDSFSHGGGSTLLARGNRNGLGLNNQDGLNEQREQTTKDQKTEDNQVEGGGWLAGIRDPLNPNKRLAQIVLRDEALSSSGNGTQFFEYEGRRYGHLIDPRTGMPTEGLLMATAMAPTAAEADALSTAFFLLGVEGTERYCNEHPEVGALLLANDPNEADKTVLKGFNLADREWQPAVE